MITSAFTCTGPYAILIMLGIKRVENRNVMPVPSKGRCAVSCSKSFNAKEYGAFVQWAAMNLPYEDFERLPAWGDVKDWPGKVVGCCDYEVRDGAFRRNAPTEAREGAFRRNAPTGESDAAFRRNAPTGESDAAFRRNAPCRDDAAGTPRLQWDEGLQYWWELSNVVCFDRPIPCRGNVGMWRLPDGCDGARHSLTEIVTATDALASCVGEKIATVEDAAQLFRLAVPLAGGNEGFFVLPLDEARCALSAPVLVSLGDPSTTAVNPGEVFAAALKLDAKGVIVAHNHPSGDPTPSIQDHELTSALVALGNQLGVRVLDHLVICSDNRCCSVRARVS